MVDRLEQSWNTEVAILSVLEQRRSRRGGRGPIYGDIPTKPRLRHVGVIADPRERLAPGVYEVRVNGRKVGRMKNPADRVDAVRRIKAVILRKEFEWSMLGTGPKWPAKSLRNDPARLLGEYQLVAEDGKVHGIFHIVRN